LLEYYLVRMASPEHLQRRWEAQHFLPGRERRKIRWAAGMAAVVVVGLLGGWAWGALRSPAPQKVAAASKSMRVSPRSLPT
jgi:hypothetical protein